MSDLPHVGDIVSDAGAAADQAARDAGIAVRLVADVEHEKAIVEMLAEIWGRSLGNPPMPPELLRAFAKAGNYIAGAFDGDQLIGAAVAFHSSPERQSMHSHIAGVRRSYIGRSVGFALKLHQRAWALEHGVGAVEWTFDPLVARNAFFNIAKLGAEPVEYLPNFYGVMSDSINGGDDSDRLLIRWDLRSERAIAAASRQSLPIDPHAPGHVCVALPENIELLRRDDIQRAHAWRLEVRKQLSSLLAAGGRIVGFDRSAGYIVKEGEKR